MPESHLGHSSAEPDYVYHLTCCQYGSP